jgi:outer membrane lipoprotein-sorting protein
MYRTYKKISLILIILVSLVGCKSTKTGSGAGAGEKSARAVLKTFEGNLADFKTANGKMKAGYESKDDSQSITITYRIEKDKAIWLSAKVMGLLPVAKVYITPDRFQYYEKINKTYFDGDFAMAEEYLGVEVDFENLQNLLIGRPMYELKKNQMLFDDNAYVFLQNIKSILAYSAIIDGRQFEMKSQSVQNINNESLKVEYSKFQTVDKKKFPYKLKMTAKKQDEVVLIDIEYRSVVFDEDLSFPFSIPNNYELLGF